jgi:hypothetical protein
MLATQLWIASYMQLTGFDSVRLILLWNFDAIMM